MVWNSSEYFMCLQTSCSCHFHFNISKKAGCISLFLMKLHWEASVQHTAETNRHTEPKWNASIPLPASKLSNKLLWTKESAMRRAARGKHTFMLCRKNMNREVSLRLCSLRTPRFPAPLVLPYNSGEYFRAHPASSADRAGKCKANKRDTR